MDGPKFETGDGAGANIEKLARLFPSAISEGKLNTDALRALLGEDVAKDEAYEFTWVGKREAIREAGRPIRKTLRPCPEESKNWDTTENLYIEGDNLDVLKLLQESYLGKVKMIYIDPPYNTGKNYIYRNDFSIDAGNYLEESGEIDESGARLVSNPRTYARFHSAWMTAMYSRLMIARNLLAKDGVLVCAIDENEFSVLSIIMKEIFLESTWEHSYVSIVHNPRGQQGVNFSYVNEYLIFIYPADGNKYLADFPKSEVDSRNLRDSGTESDRADARSCFYPFYIKGEKIVKIGKVPPDDFHPASANIKMGDGSVEIWPMTDDGAEKKWRYARQTVESIFGKLEPKIGRNSVQIIFNKDEETMRSVWVNAKYDSSEYGTKLLDKLFGGASFTFPKSLYAVCDCIKAAVKNDKAATVMDFYSGSGTTAHAVMQINAEDGGKRKFIMIQLPEDLDEAIDRSSDSKTKASVKAAIKFLDSIGKPHTICEIGKERIRRAGEKIVSSSQFSVLSAEAENSLLKTENSLELDENQGDASGSKSAPSLRSLAPLRRRPATPLPLPSENRKLETENSLDIGFRVLKLDSTNMKDVYYAPSEYSQGMLDQMTSNIKEGRSGMDLLYACLLDWGLPLNMPHAQEEIGGATVHTYGNNDLMACFADKVGEETVRAMAKRQPLRAVFRDSSFESSPGKINVEEIFKLLAPNTKVRVI